MPGIQGPLIATGGDCVKVWDTSTLQVVKQFNFHKGNVGDLCWNRDNTVLCSASASGDKVSLAKLGILPHDSVKESGRFALDEGQTCVQMARSGRKIYTAGVAGDVKIWDPETLTPRHSYLKTHTSPITCIAVNKSETHLASGSNKDAVAIRNLSSGVVEKPKVIESATLAVRAMAFSPWKHSLLAMAHDDGSLHLWDTLHSTPYHSFRGLHKASAMSVAFSPYNDLLLASVGIDKSLVLYDVSTKKLVNKVSVSEPLKSLVFMRDGVTLFSGSSLGKIFHFDIRKIGRGAVASVDAHSTAVNKIVTQNQIRETSSRSHDIGSATSTSSDCDSVGADRRHVNMNGDHDQARRLLHDRITTRRPTIDPSAASNTHHTSRVNGSAGHHLHPEESGGAGDGSHVGSSTPQHQLEEELEDRWPSRTSIGSLNFSNDTFGSCCGDGDDNVLSPIAVQNQHRVSTRPPPPSTQQQRRATGGQRRGATTTSPPHHADHNPVASKPRTPSSAVVAATPTPTNPPIANRVVEGEARVTSSPLVTSSSLLPAPARSKAESVSAPTAASVAGTASTSLLRDGASTSLLRDGASTSLLRDGAAESSTERSVGSLGGAAVSSSVESIQQFQVDFVRNIVREEVDELREDVRGWINNLHLAIARMRVDLEEQVTEQNQVVLDQLSRLNQRLSDADL